MRANRRQFLIGTTGIGLGMSCGLFGSLQYPGVNYRDYSRILPDFLRGLVADAYKLREAQLGELTNIAAIERRQEWIRKRFWTIVGGEPTRTPLNAKILGGFERDGYQVQNVLYESQPGFLIPANLYIPSDRRPPFPGVLFQMGHSLNGKAAASYQRCCQGLAKLGFLVLGFDPMGQGERTYYPEPGGTLTSLSSADDEHTVPGKQMLLVGHTSTRLQVWDAVRSLDYLASHPLVDPTRLASTGQSGGGTLTMLLAAVDKRLTVAAVSCGNTENFACLDFNPPGSTDDAEQNLIGSVSEGFDRWDLLYPLAPKPLLVLVSARDSFGTYSPRYLSSGWAEFQKLQKVYRVLGDPEKIYWKDTPLPHNLAYDLRIEIYNWLRKWMLGEDDPLVEEPETHLEEEKTLWVSGSGNVVRDFGSETPFSLNLETARRLPAQDSGADLQELLVIPLNLRKPGTRNHGYRRSGGLRIHACEVNTEKNVWVPYWLFQPRERVTDSLLVILEHSGRSGRWREGGLLQSLAEEGITICAPDLRGIGDLRPEYSRGSIQHASWHQDEEAYSWASLILGYPLLSQRVTDLVQLVEGLKSSSEFEGKRVSIAARGQMSVPALFAGCLDSRIESLMLCGGLISYRSIVETLDYEQSLASFLPGVLRETDLPLLARSIRPRTLWLVEMVDSAGRPVPREVVAKYYGESDSVIVKEEFGWTKNAILEFLGQS